MFKSSDEFTRKWEIIIGIVRLGNEGKGFRSAGSIRIMTGRQLLCPIAWLGEALDRGIAPALGTSVD